MGQGLLSGSTPTSPPCESGLLGAPSRLVSTVVLCSRERWAGLVSGRPVPEPVPQRALGVWGRARVGEKLDGGHGATARGRFLSGPAQMLWTASCS